MISVVENVADELGEQNRGWVVGVVAVVVVEAVAVAVAVVEEGESAVELVGAVEADAADRIVAVLLGVGGVGVVVDVAGSVDEDQMTAAVVYRCVVAVVVVAIVFAVTFPKGLLACKGERTHQVVRVVCVCGSSCGCSCCCFDS